MTGKRRWKHFLTVKLPANMGVMNDQTEATARMTVLPWTEMQRKKGSVGRLLFNVRLWLSR